MEKKDKTQKKLHKNEITAFVRSMAAKKALPPGDGSVNEYYEYVLKKHQ